MCKIMHMRRTSHSSLPIRYAHYFLHFIFCILVDPFPSGRVNAKQCMSILNLPLTHATKSALTSGQPGSGKLTPPCLQSAVARTSATMKLLTTPRNCSHPPPLNLLHGSACSVPRCHIARDLDRTLFYTHVVARARKETVREENEKRMV